ncbi:uncharacterized protein METZ01_LOCUS319563, partial [marine metagenome]
NNGSGKWDQATDLGICRFIFFYHSNYCQDVRSLPTLLVHFR